MAKRFTRIPHPGKTPSADWAQRVWRALTELQNLADPDDAVQNGDAAGGDLSGTYPNPTVDVSEGLRESGGTELTMASVSDGELLYRTGTTVDGLARASSDTTAIHVGVASEIHGITELTAVAQDDEYVAEDQSASYAKKRVQAKNNLAGFLASATTQIDVKSATAPSSGQVLTATGASAATWQAAAGGTDSAAIHKDVANEIDTISELTAVAQGDVYILEDVSDSKNKKKVQAKNNLSGFLASATTEVDVKSATAPSSGQVLTATSSTAATWQSVSSSFRWADLHYSADQTTVNDNTLLTFNTITNQNSGGTTDIAVSSGVITLPQNTSGFCWKLEGTPRCEFSINAASMTFQWVTDPADSPPADFVGRQGISISATHTSALGSGGLSSTAVAYVTVASGTQDVGLVSVAISSTATATVSATFSKISIVEWPIPD